jgi:hypothetical protein
MPLRLPPPPSRGLEIVTAALESLLSTQSPAARALAISPEDDAGTRLSAVAPHLVYFVGLDDVAQGRMLSAARPTSWRYILLKGDNAYAAAEVTIDEDGKVGDFSYVDRGPFAENIVAAVELAEITETARGGDYELRLLSVPALYLVALWLHGTDDLILPLAPTPGGLEAERVYTEEQVLSELEELIERRTDVDDPMP